MVRPTECESPPRPPKRTVCPHVCWTLVADSWFNGSGRVWSYECKSSSNQVRHLDEECASVASESRFELSGKGIEAIVIQIVVVAHVKRRAGIRRPAEQKLPTNIGKSES